MTARARISINVDSKKLNETFLDLLRKAVRNQGGSNGTASVGPRP